MKIALLAGGYGTRISEESRLKPKPMIEIGGHPILWHIMKIYSYYGFNDFVICLGYKGDVIKEYFAHYFLHESDVTIDFTQNGERIIHNHTAEPWKVTLVNTGQDTMTGGRIKRIQKYIGDEPFMLTYGDGVSDVNIKELVEFHKSSSEIATLTSVKPEGRFGILNIDEENRVTSFSEKSEGNMNWINGGFFVLEPEIFEYLHDDSTVFERGPLEKLANEGNLNTYQHDGFWHPMDKMSDKKFLEKLWNSGEAPWKIWE